MNINFDSCLYLIKYLNKEQMSMINRYSKISYDIKECGYSQVLDIDKFIQPLNNEFKLINIQVPLILLYERECEDIIVAGHDKKKFSPLLNYLKEHNKIRCCIGNEFYQDSDWWLDDNSDDYYCNGHFNICLWSEKD
jgi:hypothetical protein